MSGAQTVLIRDPESGEVERYTYRERVCHWAVALGYSYALLTGLALYTPHLFWIAYVLGGGGTIRSLHPWGGLAFLAGTLWMHSMWKPDMQIDKNDEAWKNKIGDYIENRDEKLPAVGRFNFGQKSFYWVMLYSMVALFVTGMVMWWPELMPRTLHWILPWAIVLHEAAALFTIGAFLIHLYMGIFIEPAALHSMISGRVPRSWAKMYHRLWYDKVAGQR